jgi:hypothetical protein
MKIAILEPDLDKLDRALETFASSRHICFGVSSDEGLLRLLAEVTVDLILSTESIPDETLRLLAPYESAIPVVHCLSPYAAYGAIHTGLTGC